MTTAVQTLLESFDSLTADEQWTLIKTLLHRTLHLDFPPLTDDELTQTADELFLIFDAEESGAADHGN
ncbi:MAG: hypothetical protein ACFCA4_00825 [Cyanophyceae cyanobacterium]